MSKPTCCGKPCQPTKKTYGQYGKRVRTPDGHIWDMGSLVIYFRCRVCNYVGVPYMAAFDSSYMNEMEAIRLAGIESDKQHEKESQSTKTALRL